MSDFWSGWVILLAALTMGASLFLFVWGLWIRIPTQADGTTGHNWDGIREGMHRLPWWWIAVSAGAFVVALGYLALYPGLGNFKGLLGWSSQGEMRGAAAIYDSKFEAKLKPWRRLTIEQMATDKQATLIGHRLYQDNCAACHGQKALGNPALGAPDLTDAVWQYGGDGKSIQTSILDGRSAEMPAWGKALGDDGVREVTAYVLSLSGNTNRSWLVNAGKARYDVFCTACHGPGGVGRAVDAPNLADHSWLYGGDFDDVATSIRDGRMGVMPVWRHRLSDDQARLVGAWVLSNASRERATEK